METDPINNTRNKLGIVTVLIITTSRWDLVMKTQLRPKWFRSLSADFA